MGCPVLYLEAISVMELLWQVVIFMHAGNV